ncbi:hypothetical protein RR46_02395 [Papilio xuthus]|nr:hypothetical protein RR46_02395 [Papilio xuthus]
MSFYNEIEKSVNLYDKLEVRKYLKVYALALVESYRHKGLGKELLKSAMLLAASAHVPAISGIFLSQCSQNLAKELGFVKFNEIYYNKYFINDQVLFTGTDENNSAALMAYRIPDVEEVADLEIQQLARFNVESEGEQNSKNS